MLCKHTPLTNARGREPSQNNKGTPINYRQLQPRHGKVYTLPRRRPRLRHLLQQNPRRLYRIMRPCRTPPPRLRPYFRRACSTWTGRRRRLSKSCNRCSMRWDSMQHTPCLWQRSRPRATDGSLVMGSCSSQSCGPCRHTTYPQITSIYTPIPYISLLQTGAVSSEVALKGLQAPHYHPLRIPLDKGFFRMIRVEKGGNSIPIETLKLYLIRWVNTRIHNSNP